MVYQQGGALIRHTSTEALLTAHQHRGIARDTPAQRHCSRHTSTEALLVTYQHRGIARGTPAQRHCSWHTSTEALLAAHYASQMKIMFTVYLHQVSEQADHFYFEDNLDKCGPIFIKKNFTVKLRNELQRKLRLKLKIN